MSAYILDQIEFDALFTALDARKDNPDYRRIFREFKGYDENKKVIWQDHTARSLVESWQKVNIQSVTERYGDTDGETLEPPSLIARFLSLSDEAIYGILTCLEYQSCEGTADQTEEYRQLERVTTWFARRIAQKQKGVEWGLAHNLKTSTRASVAPL